ncbi:arginine kinase Scy p 2.0101 [Teleopsis dalmanni]|uniref:arginine kinase Scy p 2.0101 n=1 Tax=Teleopsis dalmanni TaxID=139649 RepID=UPI0018CDC0F8|nr:arginine kinase Scy p 2.0101 [Teleopsis dalmanni]
MSSIESKRVQYRKYLERAGVIDALSKALIKLYEEQNKPEDAIRFVRKYMCESCPDDDMFDALKSDLDESKSTIFKLEQELERLRSQIKKSPEELTEELEEHFKKLVEDEDYTESLLRKYLTREVLDEYMIVTTTAPTEANLIDCCQSGFEYHDSLVGVYAADAECYDKYPKLFDSVVKDYHGMMENDAAALQADVEWGNREEVENLDPERKYILSSRIRTARNIAGYPFFPKLREKQYIDIEQKVKQAVEVLDGELAGAYFSMSDLDADMQAEMVERHILFKRGDKFLQSAGAYRFWPTGRGIFHNPAETFLVWVNEEDHLRIISMAKCGDIGDVYNRLVIGIQALERSLEFVRHPRYGYLSACPTNVGTTLRASVHIRLPYLSQTESRLNALAEEYSLQIRGTGGEHTAIEDGVMDISNVKRLGSTEFELVKSLQDGIVQLINAEQELEATGGEE